MIRLRPDRCGYIGYRCEAIAQLNPPFDSTTLNCASGADISGGAAAIIGTSAPYTEIDNYYNLPRQLRGFIMQQPGTLTNITVSSAKVAELQCSVDMDPQTADGYWNMYAASSLNSAIWVNNGSGAEKLGNNALICFAGGTMTAPGILEPMIDTPFAPISIQASTNFDASIDGIMMTLMMITKWRQIIEQRLDWMMQHLGGGGSGGDPTGLDRIANGLFNLALVKNTETECGNFKLQISGGTASPIQRVEIGSTPEYPVYIVGDGQVSVNGVALSRINGGTIYWDGGTSGGYYMSGATSGADLRYPLGFSLHLGVTLSANPNTGVGVITSDTKIYMAPPSAKPQTTSGMSGSIPWERIYIPIGGMRITSSPAAAGYVKEYKTNAYQYYMFDLWQGTCISDVAMVRVAGGSAGFVYMTQTGVSPYIVVPAATCDTSTN